MPDETANEPTLTRIGRVLEAELAMYPGRVSLIVRIVVACTLAMALVMIFRIPGAALGAYYPLLLSRDSPRSTRRSAVRTCVVCTIATAEIIVSAMLFAGSPFLHFFWVAGNLFAAFYLISSLTLYDAALAAGLLITNAIATWDLPASAETRVSITLYTLLSILIGCAVSAAVETVFAGTHANDAVREGIQQRLSLVSRLLSSYADGESNVVPLRGQLSMLSLKGMGQLRQQLAHSSYESRYKEQLGTALALTGRLVELAAALAELPQPVLPEEQARCRMISANIDAIHAELAREESPEWLAFTEAAEFRTSLLIEIERTVDLISQSLTDEDSFVHHHLPQPGEEPHLPSFVADAFTNRRHLRFAIRGTASALACYLVYMSVGWTGLGASIATCILTALTTRGASRHKQLLRFAGMIVGACVFGFTIQSIVLPQIDSLFTYSLLFAGVIAFGAWIGTSGPRIAYAGAQIVLAYDLVNLNRFTIATSLVPARDVVLGIVLGIAAMWLIFDHLWASPAAGLTHKLFFASMREVASLELSPEALTAPAHAQRLLAGCDRINAQLDRVRSLVDVSVFEAHPQPEQEVYLTKCVKTLAPQLRAFVLLDSGLLRHIVVATGDMPSPLVRDVRTRCHAVLLETCSVVEKAEAQQGAAMADLQPLRTAVERAIEQAKADGDEEMLVQMRLCGALLALAEHLHASAMSLAAEEGSRSALLAGGVPEIA